MKDLVPIEHEGQRVLLTSQLAEAYETTVRRISENFNRNSERFQEGKHFFVLEGEVKRDFLNHTQIADGLKNAQKVYLWTEKGALLHAKSLNTDKAWEVYDYLVDFYFTVKQKIYDDLSPELQAVKQILDAMAKTEREQKRQAEEQKRQANELVRHDKELAKAKQDIRNMRDIFTIDNISWRRDCGKIVKAVAYKLGGGDQYKDVNTACYQELEQTAKVNLGIRLNNLRKRMKAAGETSSACKKMTNLDIIERDPKLKEMYITIVKKMAIRYDIDPNIAINSNLDPIEN